MVRGSSLAIASLCLTQVDAIKNQGEAAAAVNPIRKVVTLLQAMQKKVAEEGEKEEAMHKNYMCYCRTNGGKLSESISAGQSKTENLGTNIKSSEAQLAGLKEALKQAQADRTAAKAAMSEGAAIREKAASAFASEKTEYDANIAAITKAIAALEKGMAGAFLQGQSAQVLKKLALKQDMLDADRQDLLAFLSGGTSADYSPQSGQITGILKEIGDEMSKGLAAATADEEDAVKSHEELMAAKTKEVNALTASIESKTTRIGELGVAIVQMKNDLTDTEQAIIADQEFAANLNKGCASKEAEWAEIQKTRAEELVALAETIKVLNDDDALELFKKTLPSAASSLVQLEQGRESRKMRALALLKQAATRARPDRAHLDFIAMALHGKKIGFGKVIKMIDDMVATLNREQSDDNDKREYCGKQLDATDDKKKSIERSISDEETAVANAEEGISALKDEIASLEAGIRDLDKSVQEATEQRRQENADFKELMASDAAAKQLLGYAKNRLNKFYNPKLYRAPPKRELSEEERIAVNNGGTATPTPAPGGIAGTGISFVEVSAHVQDREAPPPPPETFGAYAKKSGENTGVIAMIDLLVKDLDKEMTESQTAEKDAQADYETLMSDSAAKRTADSASLTEKTATKASLEGDLEAHKESLGGAKSELAATLEYISSLHAECDWLLQYFDVRKDARASEVDALKNAKAVLSGADFSLLQEAKPRGFLHRSA